MFSPFHPDTEALLVKAVEDAKIIWADADVEWSGVRFSAGHSGRYGRVIAYHMGMSGVIAFVVDNGFSMLNETPRGLRHVNAAEFSGVVLHELGHRVQRFCGVKPWGRDKAADPVHFNASWRWVCATGWSHVTGQRVTVDMVDAVCRMDPGAAHEALQVFDPARVPHIFTKKGLDRAIAAERASLTQACPCCGFDFVQAKIGRKAVYCSDACRVRGARQRKLAA